MRLIIFRMPLFLLCKTFTGKTTSSFRPGYGRRVHIELTAEREPCGIHGDPILLGFKFDFREIL